MFFFPRNQHYGMIMTAQMCLFIGIASQVRDVAH